MQIHFVRDALRWATLWQMKNEPNNSQLDKQDEASELAHVPAWEGQDDFADYNQNEANEYSNE